MNLDELKKNALSLSENERARLVHYLLSTLDNSMDSCENDWIKLASQRYQDIREGKLKVIPAEEAFNSIRNKLSK